MLPERTTQPWPFLLKARRSPARFRAGFFYACLPVPPSPGPLAPCAATRYAGPAFRHNPSPAAASRFFMDIHAIRARLAQDEPTIGTWLQLPSADVAELMARAGYDWVAVDMEHGSFGRTGLPDIFRAIQCGGAAPFARLPVASKTAVKAALEAGAQGLIFPMIESREQLDQAISWATYPGHDDGRRDGEPPRENRGVGFAGPTPSAGISMPTCGTRRPGSFWWPRSSTSAPWRIWTPSLTSRVWMPSWWAPMTFPVPWA